MKRFILVLSVLLLATGMVVAQATLSAYVSMDEGMARMLIEEFTRETGIRVDWVRLSGGEALARMEAESANPQASLWLGGVGLDHITGRTRNLTTPYRSRHADQTPVEFRCPNNYWIGLYLGPLTFVTNLDRARALGLTPPTSWADLLRPEYRGHIRMPNPTTSGTAYNVITTIRTLRGGDEDATFDYLRRLDVNIDQYTRSGAAPGVSVATGEIPIAIGYAHDQVRLRAGGANTVITAPSEGTGFELASMSLINGGRQPIEARRLYDWMISSPTVERIFNDYFLVQIRHGVRSHPMALGLDQINTITQDFAWDGDSVNRNRLLDRWLAEIGNRR